MKTFKTCKIELCATNDETRTAIHHPYLDGTNLVATDGRRLVVIPVTREMGDEDGYITRDALAQSRKLARKGEQIAIAANGSLALNNGAQLPRFKDATYPNWKQVLPAKDDPTYKVNVAFNAKYLWEMAQAMGCEKVRLAIADDVSRIMVFPCGAEVEAQDARGILMPVRIS